MRLLLALALFAIAGCDGISRKDVIIVDPAGISSLTRIDLGVAQAGARLSHPMRLRNSSVTDAHVAEFQPTCDCATILPSRLAVKAGSDQLCELVIDMRNEPNFTGELRIDVDGFDASGKTILALSASLDVRLDGYQISHADAQ
jgi:hypothetical protein